MAEHLIDVKDLRVHFHTEDGIAKAVNGIDFNIEPEKTLGVVGESGCGKSVTALTLMRLIASPPGRIESGQIIFNSNGQMKDLAALDPRSAEMRSIRGNEISMIFQDPMTSLDPSYTVGNQLEEVIRLHQDVSKKESRNRAIEMLHSVGIPSPERRVNEYAFNMSGGMRQRVMIAMALSCKPSLLIADEPTTALDVTIQAQVLALMKKLSSDFKTAILFITHDLGVISDIADDIIVMYLGKVVESASVSEIFTNPLHPYTDGLMRCIPRMTRKMDRLDPIEGTVPSLYAKTKGCGFVSRCPKALNICHEKSPLLVEKSKNHRVACWLHI